MKDRAYSKINLSLNIKCRREDGYHEIESIFVPISFSDEIEIIKNSEMIFNTNSKILRFNEDNTIYKAIYLMKERYDIKDNFIINLHKSIPSQGGLAGGSSDASCVVKMLERMYNLHINEEEKIELLKSIGADCIFTYYSKPALVSGIGEKIEFIDIKDDYYVLLCKPRSGVSTKEAYLNLNLDICDHPDMNELKRRLKEGLDFYDILGNSLEEPSMKLNSHIKKLKDIMINEGCKFALMSGSGSSVFSLSKDKEELYKISEAVKQKGYFARVCRIRK